MDRHISPIAPEVPWSCCFRLQVIFFWIKDRKYGVHQTFLRNNFGEENELSSMLSCGVIVKKNPHALPTERGCSPCPVHVHPGGDASLHTQKRHEKKKACKDIITDANIHFLYRYAFSCDLSGSVLTRLFRKARSHWLKFTTWRNARTSRYTTTRYHWWDVSYGRMQKRREETLTDTKGSAATLNYCASPISEVLSGRDTGELSLLIKCCHQSP